MTAARVTVPGIDDAALVPTLLSRPAVVEGQGSWVRCDDGRRYLDCVAGPGVHALGHGHPRVLEALREQSGRLVHSSFQLNAPAVRLAEELLEAAGPPFRRVFLANSGGEAVEAAVKLAKKWQAEQGRYGNGLVALDNGYHGRSGIALALTGMSVYKRGLPGFSLYPGVVHLPVPAGGRLPALEAALDARLQDPAVAVVAEPVQGVGGARDVPADFLAQLRAFCDETGALLVLDEVFTGLCRTGPVFAFHELDVVPDILVAGKALGGGLPIGAVLTTEEIGTCWQPVEHSTTFGANVALTAAVGSAVLGALAEEDLAARARRAGERLRSALVEAARGAGHVAGVSGRGLLLGVAFAGEQGAPPAAAAARCVASLARQGVLASVGGQERSVVRLTPPLTITDEELDGLTAAAVTAVGEAGLP